MTKAVMKTIFLSLLTFTMFVAVSAQPGGKGSVDALATVNFNLAYDKLKAKDYFGAIQTATRCVSSSTKAGLCLEVRGRAYAAIEDHDRAIADYSDVIRLDPKYTDALDLRAGVYTTVYEYEKAAADLQASMKLKPSTGPTDPRQVLLNTVNEIIPIRKRVKSAQTLQVLLEGAAPLVKGGDAAYAKKDYAAALRAYGDCAVLVPNEARCLIGIGNVHWQQFYNVATSLKVSYAALGVKHYYSDRVFANYTKVITTGGPMAATARYYRGRFSELFGLKTEAIADYREALKGKLSDADAAAARQYLAGLGAQP